MSSEWKDPGSSGEQTTNTIWEDLEDPGEDALPQGPRGKLSSENVLVLEDEGEADDDFDEPYSSRLESLILLGRQISPILVPLLFGGLTFLFVLLPLMKGHAYLAPVGLLPVLLILVAIAVVHGMLLYYAGANNVLWSLALAAGVALFLLAGCFSVFGPMVSLILLVVLSLIAFLMLRLYLHPVSEGHADIAFSLGKYSRTLFPGPNFLLPWEKIVYTLNTRETQWSCPVQTVHITREEDVHLAATIAFQLMPEDAYLAVVQVNDWEESLQKLFLTTIQAAVSKFTPRDFIAQQDIYAPMLDDVSTHWDEVNGELMHRMQDHVATWGVQVNWVHIHDVALTPRLGTEVDTGPMESLPFLDKEATVAMKGSPIPVNAPRSSNPPRPSNPPSGADKPATASPPPVTPRPASAPVPSPKNVKAETLVKTYDAVRSGTITDPETIRNIAIRFEAIANDPEASKSVSFDAARAAQTLYQRADILSEQLARAPKSRAFADYNDETQHDWAPQQSADENLTGGG